MEFCRCLGPDRSVGLFWLPPGAGRLLDTRSVTHPVYALSCTDVDYRLLLSSFVVADPMLSSGLTGSTGFYITRTVDIFVSRCVCGTRMDGLSRFRWASFLGINADSRSVQTSNRYLQEPRESRNHCDVLTTHARQREACPTPRPFS